MIRKKNAFVKLKDPAIETDFNQKLLSLYSEVDYKIICVVIDKTKHYKKYSKPDHPYHYSLECLLERYHNFLICTDGRGDVMAEARGKKEDGKIKEAYQKFYEQGTSFLSNTRFKTTLTSSDIKIKTKRDCEQGLEFADMLALATKLDVLYTFGQIDDLTPNFIKTIIDTIQPKYFTSRNFMSNQVKGFGKKFI